MGLKLFFAFISASFGLTACSTNHPNVVLQTEYGKIIIEIYEQAAPITAANFLRYVDENRFDGAHFYRVVRMNNQPNNKIKIEVIQGGLYEDGHPQSLTPIKHETTAETGILHTDGTISMARAEPGTASSEFFICIGDQPELDFGGIRNPDGRGFAAFGKVIKGMDVVKKIQSLEDIGQMLNENVMIKGFKRIE
jgi:peptidyl-prolyl cis-trans isomerase A (cyclophilin A)